MFARIVKSQLNSLLCVKNTDVIFTNFKLFSLETCSCKLLLCKSTGGGRYSSSRRMTDDHSKTIGSTMVRSKILMIPHLVNGLTLLEKDKFTTTVEFPVITVETRDLNKIRGKVRLEKYLLKNMTTVKNLMDGVDRDHKLLIFDPDVIAGDTSLQQSISHSIEEVIGEDKTVEWSTKAYEIKYENWDMRRVLRAVLPPHLEFSSFTQTGHIIHCNLRDELLPYKRVIGEILLSKVTNCRTVVNKLDGINSAFRNFELELLAGNSDYVAEVSENGFKFKLDFSKVFWNSRLSHEHERVLSAFNSKSLVYDACAGVGPFALPAARKVWSRRVMANDLNPDSVRWMKENVKLNKLPAEKIEIHNDDAVDFIRGPVADDLAKEIVTALTDTDICSSGAHVVMNLPAYSPNFLPAFRGMLYGKFSDEQMPVALPFPIVVYCYLFAKAHEDVPEVWYADTAREMVMEKLQWPNAEIQMLHHVRTVSSRKEMFCVQILLPWELLVCPPADEPPEKKRRKDD